jgi:hypothetical protein
VERSKPRGGAGRFAILQQLAVAPDQELLTSNSAEIPAKLEQQFRLQLCYEIDVKTPLEVSHLGNGSSSVAVPGGTDPAEITLVCKLAFYTKRTLQHKGLIHLLLWQLRGPLTVKQNMLQLEFGTSSMRGS